MPQYVADTSVFIDLERGGLLPVAFQLPLTLVVPDILYARELLAYGGAELLKLGLAVEELASETIERAQSYLKAKPGLSIPDCFALALAGAKGCPILTGDGLMRELAQAENVAYFGVLWLLDQILAAKVATARVLHDGLQLIAGHPRCRLPKKEVRERLEGYAKAIKAENKAA